MESDEDAALVDSFFLPGGILDPDDEDDTPVPSVPPFLGPRGAVSRVPSNPWRDEYLPVTTAMATMETTTATYSPCALVAEQVESNMASPLDGSLFRHDDNHCLTTRPPPGYTEKDRAAPITEDFANNHKNISTTGERVASDALNGLPFSHMDPLLGDRENIFAMTQTLNRLDRTIQRPASPAEVPRHAERGYNLTREGARQQQQQTHNTAKGRDTSQEDALVGSKSSKIMDFSLPTVLLNTDPEPWDGECGAEEPECTRSNTSIPLELLSIHGIYRGDSLTSSLSASTCDDSAIDVASQVGDHIAYDGEHDARDQGESVEIRMEVNSATIERIQDHACHTSSEDDDNLQHDHDAAPKARTNSGSRRKEGVLPDLNYPQRNLVDDAKNLCRHHWLSVMHGMIKILRSLGVVLQQIWTSLVKLIQPLMQIIRFASRTKKRIEECCRAAITIFSEARQAFSALLGKLFLFLQISLATIVEISKLAMAILLQIWKYSVFEAVEEPNVSVCYSVFSFMPAFCSLLVNKFNLPHWTSHLVTTIAVFSLCRQINAGAFYLGASTMLSETNDDTQPKKRGTRHPEQPSPAETHPRDERACKTILHILKLILPLFFVIDGFSTEFGTITGVSSASRLTTAFMMSLVRKNLVASPIGWISWAIQVLIATYFAPSRLADHVVLVSGLSSLRLIRYLEFQKLINEEKRSKKNA